MRALREQPRRAAAKLTITLLMLAAAALVGSALASDSPEPPDLRPRLEHSEQLSRNQARQLDRLAAEGERLRVDLGVATRWARARAQTSVRLRRQLTSVRGKLRRARAVSFRPPRAQ